MFSTNIAVLLSALALTASSAPTTSPAPESLGIALHPDAQCSTIRGSSDGRPWPSSLTPNICYFVPDGFSSMEFYAPPSQGYVNVYATKDCVEGPAYTLERQGCISGFGFPAKAIKYTLT